MLWATLALLGVPIWSVLGILGGALWNRHRFKKSPGVFRLKFQHDGADKWPRGASYARWIHDVLLINKGIGLVPTTAFGIKELVETSESSEVKGFDKAVIFTYTHDDDTVVQVAVAADDVDLVQGPFIAAVNNEAAVNPTS